ncbi:insulinase family protein [Patescibacteria group bacterium]|nr:insulinase family protein [Patescibacteria group bacterium]
MTPPSPLAKTRAGVTTPLAFRAEDAVAKSSGDVQITLISDTTDQFAWVFFPSGFQVLAALKRLPIIDMSLAIRRGARVDEIYGEAHAIEHLIVKDVLTDGPHPALRKLTPLGLETNAYTSDEVTSYWGRTLHRGWRTLLDGLVEMVFHATTIDEEHWKKERPAILQELHGRDENRRVFDAVRRARFPHVERFEATGIGREEDILALTPERLRAAYESAYHPQNAVLIVQGLATIEELVDVLRHHPRLQEAEKKSGARLLHGPLVDLGVRDDLTVHMEGSTGVERVLFSSHPFSRDKDGIPLWRAAHALSNLYNGAHGLLTSELRRHHGLIYSGSLASYKLDEERRYFTASARMKAIHMEKATTVWKDLWKNTCRELPHPTKNLKPFIRILQGDHGLERAQHQLERFHDHSDYLESRWLRQVSHPFETSMIDLPAKHVVQLLQHAPHFTDLSWQTIRVLSTRT